MSMKKWIERKKQHDYLLMHFQSSKEKGSSCRKYTAEPTPATLTKLVPSSLRRSPAPSSLRRSPAPSSSAPQPSLPEKNTRGSVCWACSQATASLLCRIGTCTQESQRTHKNAPLS